MQLPSLDRIPNPRPVGAAAVSFVGAKVIPTAPVNPSVSSAPVAEQSNSIAPTPGVVNLVNQANKPSSGEGVYTSVSDPARRGSEAATTSKDWTVRRPAPEKVEDPPRIPIYKMLMDHVKHMWAAGASAIQTEQVSNQLEVPKSNSNAVPGVIATEVLTYSPSKIKKTENI